MCLSSAYFDPDPCSSSGLPYTIFPCRVSPPFPPLVAGQIFIRYLDQTDRPPPQSSSKPNLKINSLQYIALLLLLSSFFHSLHLSFSLSLIPPIPSITQEPYSPLTPLQMSNSSVRPTSVGPYKAVLFDIGGVVVGSPFQGIADFEVQHNLPVNYLNVAM